MAELKAAVDPGVILRGFGVRRILRSRICAAAVHIRPGSCAPDPFDSAQGSICFVIMTALRGRYRLGVRTEDSQSSNPGSIPGSATNIHAGFPLVAISALFHV